MVAPDQPITNAELARRIDHLGGDLHDDLREIKLQIEKLVPREVYDAQRISDQRAVAALEARIAVLESRGRWLIGTIVFPALLLLTQFLLAIKGVKP